MSVSKIHCTDTRMFNGKLIDARVSNMLSCFPPSQSSKLQGTAYTHLTSFPLTASSLLFPSCNFVHPSQKCCPLQEQLAWILIESNLQSPFSCILSKGPPPLYSALPLFSLMLQRHCPWVWEHKEFVSGSLAHWEARATSEHQIHCLFLLSPVPMPFLPGSRCCFSGPKDVYLLSAFYVNIQW